MARQRPLPKRPTRSRVQTCINGDIHERVDLYCAHYGLTEGRFFELAALEKLNGVGDAKTMARQLAQVNEKLDIISEHQHQHVKLWMQNTQLFTREEREAGRRETTALFQWFVRQITTNLTGGTAFLDACQQTLRPPKSEAAVTSSANPSSKKTAA